jgi:fructosamine-3-kinase
VDGEQKQEKVIEVLKRLENNTRLVEEAPPATSDAELNKALAEVANGENLVPSEALRLAMDIVNGKLEKMMQEKEVGIEPNMILAIAWLERQGYAILKNLSYEDQQGAYKKPWLHSILKFQELTASAQPFNAEEFNKFILKLSRAKDLKEAYKSVMNRTLRQVSDLATVYGKTNKSHISGALWSGNIAHELTALTDLKPATTTYGDRHKKEQEMPLHLRNTGD